MENTVKLTIEGRQKDAEGEETNISFTTYGKMLMEENGYIISYDETEENGTKGVTTIFIVGKLGLSMLRTGALQSEMHFKEGEVFETMYETPYGAMDMVIKTKSMKMNMSAFGGEFAFSYGVSLSGALVGENEFMVKVSLG